MEEEAKTTQAGGPPREWRYGHLVCALFVAVVLQTVFLPCLCAIGNAKITLAYLIDTLVIGRMAIARFRHEKGKGWIFYTVLLYTSPLWIEGASWIVFGRH